MGSRGDGFMVLGLPLPFSTQRATGAWFISPKNPRAGTNLGRFDPSLDGVEGPRTPFLLQRPPA
jgi:hypothetical protein